jgi:hypothetical protein
MTKNLLIPIDFSVASLNTLKVVLENHKDKKFNVILFYSEILDDSITDLLFYNPNKIIKSKLTEEFSEAVEILKNRFQENIESLKIKLYHGLTKKALHNFLSIYQVDLIGIPKNYKFKSSRNSFNPIPNLIKSNIKLEEVYWEQDNFKTESEQLLSLFNKF